MSANREIHARLDRALATFARLDRAMGTLGATHDAAKILTPDQKATAQEEDIHARLDAQGDFDESEHKRDTAGRFTKMSAGEHRPAQKLRPYPEKYKTDSGKKITEQFNKKIDHILTQRNALELLRKLNYKPTSSFTKYIDALINEIEEEGGIPAEARSGFVPPKGAPPTPAAAKPAPPQPATTKATPQAMKKAFGDVKKALAARAKIFTHKKILKEEIDYTEVAFDKADETILGAIAATRPLNNVTVAPSAPGGGGSFYNTYHVIHIASDKSSSVGKSVWRHEMGHAIDWDDAPVPRSFRAKSDMLEESMRFDVRQNFPRDLPTKPREELRKEIIAGLEISNEDLEGFTTGSPLAVNALWQVLHGKDLDVKVIGECVQRTKDPDTLVTSKSMTHRIMLHDFIGAMTLNKYGWGHSNEYYAEREHGRPSEMFANYVSLVGSEHGKIYKAVLHKVAPQCCKHFDDILKERATKALEKSG